MIGRAQQTLHTSKHITQPLVYLRHRSQNGLNIFPHHSPMSLNMNRGWDQQTSITSSTGPRQGHTLFLLRFLTHHQGWTLRNLQGWTWEGPVPIYNQEAIKISGHGIHWQHNAKHPAKKIQLPIRFQELPRNTGIWSRARRGKFWKGTLLTSWYIVMV